MSATLFLVRHATPDWSRTDIRYDVPPGPPLTEQGEREAQQVGEFLAPLNVSQIYASPLERAHRTAFIAAAVIGAPVETNLDLAEWQQGEQESAVLARVRTHLHNALDERVARGPIAFVSHGGPIRLLLEDLGLDRTELDHYRRQFDHENPLPPAGVWRITRNGQGQIEKPEFVFAPQFFVPYVPATVHL